MLSGKTHGRLLPDKLRQKYLALQALVFTQSHSKHTVGCVFVEPNLGRGATVRYCLISPDIFIQYRAVKTWITWLASNNEITRPGSEMFSLEKNGWLVVGGCVRKKLHGKVFALD